MCQTQSLFQVSNFVDFILVIDCPRDRCAPEQFIHTKTPKSKEAPNLKSKYSMEILSCSLHIGHSQAFLIMLLVFFIVGLEIASSFFLELIYLKFVYEFISKTVPHSSINQNQFHDHVNIYSVFLRG